MICSTGFVVSGQTDQLQASISLIAVVNISIKERRNMFLLNTAAIADTEGACRGRKQQCILLSKTKNLLSLL